MWKTNLTRQKCDSKEMFDKGENGNILLEHSGTLSEESGSRNLNNHLKSTESREPISRLFEVFMCQDN